MQNKGSAKLNPPDPQLSYTAGYSHDAHTHTRSWDIPPLRAPDDKPEHPNNAHVTRPDAEANIGTVEETKTHISKCHDQIATIRAQMDNLSASMNTLMTTLTTDEHAYLQDPAQDNFHDALLHAPVSAMLFDHKAKTNNTIASVDIQYYSNIPAYLTRGDANTPSRYRRPERGNVVIITRSYMSKVWGHEFQQLHLIGIVK